VLLRRELSTVAFFFSSSFLFLCFDALTDIGVRLSLGLTPTRTAATSLSPTRK
jgi:hypothetical protein